MISLSTLKPFPGSVSSRKRLGRGIGSGRGKTSGRGHKGSGARSGKGKSVRFEGGQMPLHMRLPKRGFRSKIKKPASVNWVNIQGAIEKGKIDVSQPITIDILKKHSLVRTKCSGFRVLGKEGLEQAVTVHADGISQGARALLLKQGGTFVPIAKKQVMSKKEGEKKREKSKKIQPKEVRKSATSQEPPKKEPSKREPPSKRDAED